MIFPLGFAGSRWCTLARNQEKWAFSSQQETMGRLVLLVSSLLAPGPDPGLWRLVRVLQLPSLVDAESSYCVWKHHWGEAFTFQEAGGCLLCLPYPTSQLRGPNPMLLSWSLFECCFSGNLFCPSKKKRRSGSPSDYSSWHLSILKLHCTP